jgi:transketolase
MNMSGTQVTRAMTVSDLDELCVNTIRTLSIDAVQAVNSGHPGTPMAPRVTARIAIEQASTFGWERYIGSTGRIIGMNTFGASAPLKALQKKFGFDPDHVVTNAKEIVGK